MIQITSLAQMIPHWAPASSVNEETGFQGVWGERLAAHVLREVAVRYDQTRTSPPDAVMTSPAA